MDKKAYLAEIEKVIKEGPYDDTWDSLCEHPTPRWYEKGKFGIFIHWGVYSVPAFGNEWYPRYMYQKGSRENLHHETTYGTLDKFGYKDFIPMFRAEKGCPEKYNEQELLFGKSALQSSPQVMREFLEKRLKSIRKIREGLPEGREESRIRNRREELEKEIKLLERTLLEYRKGKGISDEVSGDNRKN